MTVAQVFASPFRWPARPPWRICHVRFDLRDRKHFLACMKASEVYTGYGARDIVYQVWPVVADGSSALGVKSHTFSKSAGLVLRAANSP